MIIFSENWHDPVRCHLIKKWIKKCDDDRCVTFERWPNWLLIAQTRKEVSNFCMRQCCTDQKKSVLAACRLYNRCANIFKCVARQAIGSLPTPRSAQRYVKSESGIIDWWSWWRLFIHSMQCGATIEKDGGCNHMICKNQSCKVKQMFPKFLPIQTSRLTSVGCALDPGSHMVALGTTATGKREHCETLSWTSLTGTMRTKPRVTGTIKKPADRLFRDTSSTATGEAWACSRSVMYTQ